MKQVDLPGMDEIRQVVNERLRDDGILLTKIPQACPWGNEGLTTKGWDPIGQGQAHCIRHGVTF